MPSDRFPHLELNRLNRWYWKQRPYKDAHWNNGIVETSCDKVLACRYEGKAVRRHILVRPFRRNGLKEVILVAPMVDREKQQSWLILLWRTGVSGELSLRRGNRARKYSASDTPPLRRQDAMCSTTMMLHAMELLCPQGLLPLTTRLTTRSSCFVLAASPPDVRSDRARTRHSREGRRWTLRVFPLGQYTCLI